MDLIFFYKTFCITHDFIGMRGIMVRGERTRVHVFYVWRLIYLGTFQLVTTHTQIEIIEENK